MGVWSFGIFDNDVAADYFDTIQKQLVTEVEAVFADKKQFAQEMAGQGHLLASVSMLGTLCQAYDHSFIMNPDIVKQWRDRYMKAFEEMQWPESYESGRHVTIVDAFSRLMRYTEKDPE